MTISAAALERVGIRVSPDELEEMLLDVVTHMLPVSAGIDPRHELTPLEAAALARGGFDIAPVGHDRADPIGRTAAAYAALLATSLTVAEAAQVLGVDASRVRQRLAARTLYGIKTRGGWRLPRFQFDADGALAGVELVLPHVDPDLHPLALAGWFDMPNVDLLLDDEPVSPRDWLRSGGHTAVVAELAAAL